jgi:Domain of unknown function (DUF4388)
VFFQSPVDLTLTNIMALVGNLRELPFTDLIQICCAFRGTTHIKLDFGDNSGSVFLRNFEIIDAEIGDLKGEKAFYKILLQKDGKFLTETDPKFSPIRTINRSWGDILFDGMRLVRETTAIDPPKPLSLQSEISDTEDEIIVLETLDESTVQTEITEAEEIAISETSGKSIDSGSSRQTVDDIEDEEEIMVVNTPRKPTDFTSNRQAVDEDEDEIMVLKASSESTGFDSNLLEVDEINNQTTVHFSSEDNGQFELDVQNSSDEHDALLQKLLSSGVVKGGVVIDENGSTICELSENDPKMNRLAFLVKGIEDIVMPAFNLGDLNGAVLEIQQKSLLVKNFQNLSLVFTRPERVPIVRAFEGVQKAFEGALGLPK